MSSSSYYQMLSPGRASESINDATEGTWSEAPIDPRDVEAGVGNTTSSVLPWHSNDVLTEPVIYRYVPTKAFPKIRMYYDKTEGAALKAIIRRSCLIIVTEKQGDWWNITASGYSGWANTAPMSTREVDMLKVEKVTEIRRHEDWRGNNHFYCRGNIMFGSDARFFGITNIILVVPSVLFFTFIISDFYGELPGTIAYWSLLSLALFAYTNLWITALLEPGIIPRQAAHIKATPPPGAPLGDHGWKYCETCNIYRPPRSKHCASCQNCVEGFDVRFCPPVWCLLPYL